MRSRTKTGRSVVLAAMLAIAVTGRSANAQETMHGGTPVDLPGPSSPDALIDPGMKRSWREGETRPFASLTVDVGYLYLRPRGAIGYGKPFNNWIGLEANPLISSAGFGGYGGLRLALSYFDVRVGGRFMFPFLHSYLTPKEQYNRLDLDAIDKDPAHIYTLEAEANIGFPLGPGDVLATGSISYVGNVPDNSYVFEETLRVIVAPPWVWRGRGGYVFRFGSRDQHSIGPVADFLNVPNRDDSITVRIGPVMRVQLSRHFDVRGSFVTTVISPDRLGLVGGDFTELGVRYRTATE